MKFSRRAFVLAVAFLCLPIPAQTTRPLPEVQRVLIVSIDGLRPDLALRAKAPALRSLMERGCFTFWAKTIPEAITLPSHTSMVTGVGTDKHQITWNTDLPPGEDKYPPVPTLFELAKKAGLSTALVSGKSKLISLAKPGTVDWAAIRSMDDDTVAQNACEIVASHKPQVTMVHLPMVDAVGHEAGWGSDAHLKAIEGADAALGRILKVMDEQKLTDSTLIILSADHGGTGNIHGANDPRSRFIPWIAAGPGVRKNHDLDTDQRNEVNTQDTFATACWVMGIPLPADIEGKPVTRLIADPPPATRPKTRRR